MEFDRIYSLVDGGKSNCIRLSPKQLIQDFRYVSNGENLEKLDLIHEEGDLLCDFISLSIGGVFLVSPKVIKILKEENISGWASYDVNVEGLAINELQYYSALSIKGSCGPIENDLSKQAVLPPLMPNGPERNTFLGILFNQETWDNSEMFTPKDTAFVYVTQRVKDLFEKHGISNCSFQRITEIENYDRLLGF